MSIEALKAAIPDFAKDVRLNLSTIASDETLSKRQKYGLFVSCGIASRNKVVREALEAEARAHLTETELAAAKTAASLMGMNNVYYRFLHLVTNPEYKTLPARLRMNAIASPGVDKADFELWCVAVSAINGCGICIDSHEEVLRKAGMPNTTIQAAVRYAAIVQSVAIALEAAGE